MNRLRALYAGEKRWVNWELRNGKKLPINARTGNLAKSDDSSTWSTYEQAKKRSDKIGVMLGHVNKYHRGGYYLCGVDLDGCLNGETLRSEAREIVERWGRYTEVSPSGRGVHIIFAVNAKDVEKIREQFGVLHRKTFSIGPHQEIALDLSNRYYTVTEDEYNDYDLIDSVKLGNLEWFIRDAGPAFQGTFDGGNHERDNSRSGYAFRHFVKGISSGMSEEAIVEEIKKRRDPAGEWARTKGRDLREMHRVYANALRSVENKGKNGHELAPDYLTSQLASEIEIKPIRWMWPYYFAYGKLGMIVGEPDRGKSTVSLDLAARVSRGSRWPDKSGRAPRGDVLLLNAEDDNSDTVAPRLKAAGADMSRIRFLTMKSGRMFSLAENLKMLEDHITKNTRMVIIDPISTYLGIGVDSFRGNEVRGILSPMVVLSEKYGILTLILHHFNKGSSGGKTAMHRISDSHAFGAMSRHIYICEQSPDPDQEEERGYGFLKLRNSVAPADRGSNLGYSLESVNLGDGIITSRVVWDDKPLDWTFEEAQKSPKNSGLALQEAEVFLKSELKDKPEACAKVIEKAELRNISRRTLYRAAESLNVNKINISGVVMWSLAVE